MNFIDSVIFIVYFYDQSNLLNIYSFYSFSYKSIQKMSILI